MQNALTIDDAIYSETMAAAAREGVTLKEFVEKALRLRLDRAAVKNGELMENQSSRSPASDPKLTQAVQKTEGPIMKEADSEERRKRRERLAQFFAALILGL